MIRVEQERGSTAGSPISDDLEVDDAWVSVPVNLSLLCARLSKRA